MDLMDVAFCLAYPAGSAETVLHRSRSIPETQTDRHIQAHVIVDRKDQNSTTGRSSYRTHSEDSPLGRRESLIS